MQIWKVRDGWFNFVIVSLIQLIAFFLINGNFSISVTSVILVLLIFYVVSQTGILPLTPKKWSILHCSFTLPTRFATAHKNKRTYKVTGYVTQSPDAQYSTRWVPSRVPSNRAAARTKRDRESYLNLTAGHTWVTWFCCYLILMWWAVDWFFYMVVRWELLIKCVRGILDLVLVCFVDVDLIRWV